MVNQNPEQRARDQIDKQLTAAGWVVQSKKAIDFSAGRGMAVREYQTDIGHAAYRLPKHTGAKRILNLADKNLGELDVRPYQDE